MASLERDLEQPASVVGGGSHNRLEKTALVGSRVDIWAALSIHPGAQRWFVGPR